MSSRKKKVTKCAESSTSPAVTIRLRSRSDDSGEYGAFRSVTVDVLVNGTKGGHISATLIDRQKIPERAFPMAMDGHSSALEWIGSTLYESRRGRPRLQSMARYDNEEFDILFIEEMHVDDEWKVGGNSDVGAEAIRLMLHHPRIRGGKACERNGVWSASSAVYILDPFETMTEREKEEQIKRQGHRSDDPVPPETEESLKCKREERARIDALARSDANQFLRNGFFQDEAVARKNEHRGDERVLVATYGQWSHPLKSHDEVSSIKLYVPPPKPNPPTGKDSELLNLIRSSRKNHPLGGNHGFKTEVRRIISEGGSLLRSHALHAAVGVDSNDHALVNFILETEALTVNALDESGFTPLMHAAISAAWRQNIYGMPETHIIDRLLVAGARKEVTSTCGRTAFGYLVKQMDEMSVKMTAENGWAGINNETPGLREIALKIIPSTGPTDVDVRGNEMPSGFIDYTEDDKSWDRECGSGDSSDDDDY